MDVERCMELVSPKVGLIRALAPQGRGAEEPVPPYLYTATLAHFDFRNADKTERLAAGKGGTESEAIASAIAEAVERYCAFQWDPSRTYTARWSDVAPAAMAPGECVLYSAEQYQRPDWMFVPWREDQVVSWIDGVELPSRQRIALPAGLVFLVTPPPRPEDFFVPASSNGLAAASTLDGAVLAGICELIERDTLLITWMNRLPATEIDLPTAGDIAASIARHYARLAVEVRAFVLPSNLPATTILALALDDDTSRPAQVVGMGCHPNPETALIKALFELCQGRPSEARRFIDKPPRGRLQRYEDVKTLDDHSAFVSLPERRNEFAFLWAHARRTSIGEMPNPSRGDATLDLEYITAGLAGRGYRVAYADLTLADVAPYGIHAVRTLISDLQPVHFGYGLERLGGRRLFEVPQQLGFADRACSVRELNQCPHPLA